MQQRQVDALTNVPVSHDKVSPMKNPPRGGNIILCKFLSPYANLAYPMTKSPPPLKFRRSRRDTIAPREVFAPTFDRFLDDGMITLSPSCVKPMVSRTTAIACRVTKRLKSIVDVAK